MRFLFRRLWIPLYSIWALRYVRSKRMFRHAGLRLEVPPGVFHPGVFFSTPIFISFLQKIDFQEKTVLDVGTGSGLLALYAAQRGASVTALDINPLAIEATRRNAAANGLAVAVVESDLFAGLPPRLFDIVLINPPYYPADPRDHKARAFFAGQNWEYFDQLFRQLPGRLGAATQTWMILSENCNLAKIKEIAAASDLELSTVFEKTKWGERFQVMAIVSTDNC